MIHLHGQIMKNRFSNILEILLIVNYEKLREKTPCTKRIHTSREHHHNTTLLLSYYSLWPKWESMSKSSLYHFMCDLSVYCVQKNEREDTAETLRHSHFYICWNHWNKYQFAWDTTFFRAIFWIVCQEIKETSSIILKELIFSEILLRSN